MAGSRNVLAPLARRQGTWRSAPVAHILHTYGLVTLLRAHAATLSAGRNMPSPLVVDALREQLLRVLEWYRHERPAFGWGVGLHRRNERGKLRFGAVTPAGESLLLTQPLLSALAGG